MYVGTGTWLRYPRYAFIEEPLHRVCNLPFSASCTSKSSLITQLTNPSTQTCSKLS